MLLGALSVFMHFRRCLCVIWRLDSPGRKRPIETLLKYGLTVVMVLSVGILLFLSLAVSTALPLLVDYLGKDFPVGARFWRWLDGVNIWFSMVHCPNSLCTLPKPCVMDELELVVVWVNVSKTWPSGMTEPSMDEADAGLEPRLHNDTTV